MWTSETVMMIANIMDSLPDRKCQGPRTTLIVATNALVIQWAQEIKKHVRPEPHYMLRVMVYKKSMYPHTDPVQTMEAADVVLTTYDEVRKSYPKEEFPIELQTAEDKQRWWREFYEREKGSLHRIRFLRVVYVSPTEVTILKN